MIEGDQNMKRLTRYAGLIAGASLLTAGLGGCATSGSDERCRLLAIAYDEQDELAGPWYENAAAELRECGYENASDPKKRGRDADGHYRADK